MRFVANLLIFLDDDEKNLITTKTTKKYGGKKYGAGEDLAASNEK